MSENATPIDTDAPTPGICTAPAKSAVSKPILSVDFDGTLHSYTSGWKGADVVTDPPIQGAMRFLTDATEKFEVHIYSSRSGKPGGIMAMYDYLKAHLNRYWVDMPEVAEKVLSQLKFPVEKPAAHVILDDRAVPFNGTYPDVDELVAFQPWNRRSDGAS